MAKKERPGRNSRAFENSKDSKTSMQKVSKVKREVVSKGQAKKSAREVDMKILAFGLFLIVVAYGFLMFTSSPGSDTQPICKNLCGDGVCQDLVCMGGGCPCAETNEKCPQDCKASPVSICGKNYPFYSDEAHAECSTSGGHLMCTTVCSGQGACKDESCQCDCGGTVQATEPTIEEKARAVADKYVHSLYCFNNYNSSNLRLLNFTKLSDQNGGTYRAVYIFNIDSERMANVSAMKADLIISNNVVVTPKISRVSVAQEGFCGYSTNGPCTTDGDCFSAGCSGQICQSKSDASAISTCEWKDCYAAEKYNLSCKCMNNQCVWS